MTATQWLEILASYSLQVLIVVVVCTWLERAIVRTPDRCAVWNACFLSTLLLGAAALLLPRLHLIQPWSRLPPQTLLTVSAAQTAIGRMLLAVWCIGASVSFFRWIARGHRIRRLLRRCERMPTDDFQRLLQAMQAQSRFGPLPRILISDEVESPFCWQVQEPTVVLPRYLLESDRDDLYHVLVHELEHLKTNHPLQLFLQHVAQVVCWFHPAVWNAGWRAALAREFTCDEAAANHGANSAAYLRTLLHIAERCEEKRKSPALGFGRSASEIILRARRLVELARSGNVGSDTGWLSKHLAIALLLATTCLTAMVCVPCDPLASSRSVWSPWPKWTAVSLHCFGYCVRDYEPFDRRTQVYELMRESGGRVPPVRIIPPEPPPP